MPEIDRCQSVRVQNKDRRSRYLRNNSAKDSIPVLELNPSILLLVVQLNIDIGKIYIILFL